MDGVWLTVSVAQIIRQFFLQRVNKYPSKWRRSVFSTDTVGVSALYLVFT